VSRARRILGGLGLGYLNLAVVMIAGIWLTRFFISHLGERRYGLWLIGTQFIGYALLLDVGVLQLLPRQVAFATGRSRGWRDARDLPVLIGETFRLVLYQAPALALVATAGVLLIPAEWAELRGPMAVVAAVLVAVFPFRVPQAVLSGLQDLAFVGRLQLAVWAAATAATVGGVLAGFGLYAFAAGYAVSQLLGVAIGAIRLRRAFPGVLPARLPPLAWSRAWAMLRSGGWMSVGQVAHILLTGTDLLVIGRLLGPGAVVVYACTGKLLSATANLPQMMLPVAGPALSELRTGASKERLFDAAQALGQLMVIVSGAIAVGVVGANEAFVSWWVGPSRYGGTWMTLLLAVQLVLRHWNLSLTTTLFSVGRERRTALTSLGDGFVTVGGLVVFTRWLGPTGAPLGAIAGALLVTLPANLAGARQEGWSAMRWIAGFGGWAWRLVALVAAGGLAARWYRPAGVAGLCALGAALGGVYVWAMWPVLARAPLGTYALPRITAAAERARGALRRLRSGAYPGA
jgi:O-antigen/teichoic acid export membrane protein